jgi:putative phosphoesterase
MFTSKNKLETSYATIQSNQNRMRIAILADTHVPDRVSTLHPDLLPSLIEAKIDYIFHCGDLTHQCVLAELNTVAPVAAVMGNRDIFFSNLQLPFKMQIEVLGQSIGLFHGFRSMKDYFLDKFDYLIHGYHFDRYHAIGRDLFPAVDILCFGHTHFAEIRRFKNQLVINPGTSGPNSMNGGPSWVLLEINERGCLHASFQPLLGYSCKKNCWQPENSLHQERL